MQVLSTADSTAQQAVSFESPASAAGLLRSTRQPSEEVHMDGEVAGPRRALAQQRAVSQSMSGGGSVELRSTDDKDSEVERPPQGAEGAHAGGGGGGDASVARRQEEGEEGDVVTVRKTLSCLSFAFDDLPSISWRPGGRVPCILRLSAPAQKLVRHTSRLLSLEL